MILKEEKRRKKDSYLSASSLFKLSGAELDRLDSYLGESEVNCKSKIPFIQS
jgi:hypothetical protein